MFESQGLRNEADELGPKPEWMTHDPSMLERAWWTLLHHTGGLSLQALPHTRGIALYAGITATAGARGM
jgi:hypothetical protein